MQALAGLPRHAQLCGAPQLSGPSRRVRDGRRAARVQASAERPRVAGVAAPTQTTGTTPVGQYC